jgi:hypothetical protein
LYDFNREPREWQFCSSNLFHCACKLVPLKFCISCFHLWVFKACYLSLSTCKIFDKNLGEKGVRVGNRWLPKGCKWHEGLLSLWSWKHMVTCSKSFELLNSNLVKIYMWSSLNLCLDLFDCGRNSHYVLHFFGHDGACFAMVLHNFAYPRTLFLINLPTRWTTMINYTVLVN